jgi:hypothetical protein
MITGEHLSIRTVGDLAEKIHNINKKNGGQRKSVPQRRDQPLFKQKETKAPISRS